jgi:hypothetical protein
MADVDDFRARLGMRLVYVSTIALVALAIFIVIGGEDWNLADAKAKMESLTGCQDVIVTHQGNAGEPVLGWISNVDIARLSQA